MAFLRSWGGPVCAIEPAGFWGPCSGLRDHGVDDLATVVISHRLGRSEAVRRLKDGLARTNGQLGSMIAIDQATWQGDTLRFSMRALGQFVAASVEVLEDALRIEVSLPRLLAKAVKRLIPILAQGSNRPLWRKSSAPRRPPHATHHCYARDEAISSGA